jgi:hypothetical protein
MSLIRANIAELYGNDLLFMDEAHFDDAILGVAERADGNHVVAYDTVRILQILEQEMSPDEAREYFDFNISCAWVGEKTPVYINSQIIVQGCSYYEDVR